MQGEEDIKKYSGEIIGIIETKDNGDQIARAFPGRQVLGFYRKSQDQTTDFYGRVISRGNTVVSLIYEDKNR